MSLDTSNLGLQRLNAGVKLLDRNGIKVLLGELRQRIAGLAREEILEVALSVLAERGYRGASMREIAERAQASKETLYSRFGNKRELFEESWSGGKPSA